MAPDVDPFEMRLAAAGTGGVTVVNQGGHTDVLLDNPTHFTRVGVRLDWGGSVVFFGLVDNPASNVIDANDTGRELQLAIYDPDRMAQGCAHNASCATGPHPCATAITFLGWNPVQGGDECNHGSTATHRVLPDGMEVVVHPLQWNPDWAAPDCRTSACSAAGVPVDVTYVMQFRFLTQHVVHLSLEVQSQEVFDHAVTAQEFPTLYVAHGQGGPDLPLLLDADGTAITINVPANDGFFVRDFTSPRPWVTFQNADRTYGVGMAMDQGINAFQGWHGNGSTAPYFHNVRAFVPFGLRAGGVVRGGAYLALGSEGTVRTELDDVMSRRAPFGHVDVPAAGATTTVTAGAMVPVGGWVLDGDAVTAVELQVDGVVATTLTPNGDRPDVCQVYPGYAACPRAGFSGMLNTAGMTGCHRITVVARDVRGNTQVLGERLLLVR